MEIVKSVKSVVIENAHMIPFFIQLFITSMEISNPHIFFMSVTLLLSYMTIYVHEQYLWQGFFGIITLIVYAIALLAGFNLLPMQSSRTLCSSLALAYHASGHRHENALTKGFLTNTALSLFGRPWTFAVIVVLWTVLRTKALQTFHQL